ncbi:MAG: hypothetical protein KGO96_14115 [Elusimicrobia bacterium]|nr:hypothetical protein [Elusimicrobiota bacterium]
MRAALLCLLLALSWPASAQISPEFGISVSHATARHNGTWWQQGFPFALKLNRPAVMAGIRYEATPHVDLHADAVWLGRDSSSALATSDENYSATNPTHCNGPCLPLSHFYGRGWAAGLRLVAGWHSTGRWQWGLHGGPIEYREAWRMDVPDWYPSRRLPDGTYVTGTISPVHINRAAWKLGWTVGATLTRGRYFASLDWYRDGADIKRPEGIYPPIWRWHTLLTLGITL